MVSYIVHYEVLVGHMKCMEYEERKTGIRRVHELQTTNLLHLERMFPGNRLVQAHRNKQTPRSEKSTPLMGDGSIFVRRVFYEPLQTRYRKGFFHYLVFARCLDCWLSGNLVPKPPWC